MAHRCVGLVVASTMDLLLAVHASIALAQDEERASPGDWLYLVVLLTIAAAVTVAAAVASARGVNPHTGRRSKVGRRRRRRRVQPRRGPG